MHDVFVACGKCKILTAAVICICRNCAIISSRNLGLIDDSSRKSSNAFARCTRTAIAEVKDY